LFRLKKSLVIFASNSLILLKWNNLSLAKERALSVPDFLEKKKRGVKKRPHRF